MQTICILGRQPALSLAELEACFGASKVQPLGTTAALIDEAPEQVRVAHLGGTIKIAAVQGEIPTTAWDKISAACLELLPEIAASLPEGKIQLGISTYGLQVRTQTLQRGALTFKKQLRAEGRSVRVIPNQEPALNSAQVFHNHLTGPTGIELILVAAGNSTYAGRTVAVQDIDDYSRRDFGRPKRSSFVGMLPPKLAQIMLHLAGVRVGHTVLDPFCGTGVVLQEAILLGATPVGTDIEPKMIDFSRQNLQWLTDTYSLANFTPTLAVADARSATWPTPIDHVVCETYLGQPMTNLPPTDKLATIQAGCNSLISDFLRNLHSQLTPDTRCVVAVPAWRTASGFLHLPLVDQLSQLGYNRVSFEHASNRDLIYHRTEQIVARELLVLTRK